MHHRFDQSRCDFMEHVPRKRTPQSRGLATLDKAKKKTLAEFGSDGTRARHFHGWSSQKSESRLHHLKNILHRWEPWNLPAFRGTYIESCEALACWRVGTADGGWNEGPLRGRDFQLKSAFARARRTPFWGGRDLRC